MNKELVIKTAIALLLISSLVAGNFSADLYAQAPTSVPPKSLYNSPGLGSLPEYEGNETHYGAKGLIDDNDELKTLLGAAGDNKWIKLEDNIAVTGDFKFEFNKNTKEELVIELDWNNFTTDSNFIFEKTSGLNGAEITIIGSSMLANGGLQIRGDGVTLNYFGTYASGRADILAENSTDDIEFNLTGFGSRWDADNNTPKFVDKLPLTANVLEYDTGTIVIGEQGKATVNITSGNDVLSGETIIGAQSGSTGTLNISGLYEIDNIYNVIDDKYERIKKPTTWDNTGTIYIGYAGTGTANVSHGAFVRTGSIGIGITATTGNGTLNVDGLVGLPEGMNYLDETKNPEYIVPQGTPLNRRDYDYIADAIYFNPDATKISIYGRDDEDSSKFLSPASNSTSGMSSLVSAGTGVMNIKNGAIIEFDETKTDSGEPSNFTPKITLGSGNSIVDNSLITGARDALDGDRDYGGTNDNFDDVGLILGTTGTNLTFQNNAVLQGNLKINVGTLTFTGDSVNSKSILSPGFSSYQFYMPSDKPIEHERFGRMVFTNTTFVHDTNATTIIDFDVHGDRNYRTNPAKQTAYPTGLNPAAPIHDNQPYADNAYYRGRDLIIVEGNADLKGDVYFRPQTGYYSDNVKVDFMRVTGTITGQYERLHLYPYRWFTDPDFEIENSVTSSSGTYNYNQFVAKRCTTPFTDVARNFNQRGVGGALNNIYNAQNNDKWLPILDWVWCMNDDQLREAERLLSGEIKASSFYMPIRSPWRFGFDRVNWSNNGHKVYFGPQNAEKPQFTTNTVWATGYYDYQSIDDDHNSSAIATQRVSLMAGYDRALPAYFNVGAFSDSAIGALFSYSQPKLDQKGNRVITDDYLVGFHSATRFMSTYEIKSWLGVGTQKYRLHRTIPIPNEDHNSLRSSYKGNSASGSIQVARPIKWYGLTFRPHLALDLNYVKQNHALESYQSEVMKQTALRYYNSDWTQLFARTGLRLDYSRNCFNIHATLGYSYLTLGQQAPKTTHEFAYAGGGKFNILGNNPNRSFANVDLGTQLHLNKQKSRLLYLQYNGNYGKYMNAHTASVGYQFMF
jgi:hypothetical protein